MRVEKFEIEGGEMMVPLFTATEGLALFWRCVRLLKTLFPKFDGGGGRDLMNALGTGDLTVLYNALDVSGVDHAMVLTLAKDLLRQSTILRNGEAFDLGNKERLDACFEGAPVGLMVAAFKAAQANFGESFGRMKAGASPLDSKRATATE